MKSVNRLLFYITYPIFLLLFIDSRMLEPSFSHYNLYAWCYSIFWLVLGIPFLKNVLKRGLKINKDVGKIYFIFVGYFVLFIAMSMLFSNMKTEVTSEILRYIRFLSAVLLTVFWVNKLEIERFFIIISSLIPLVMIAVMFISNGAPFEVFSHLGNLLGSTDRFRLDFGYYHVNGLGNLCLYSIIVSIIALYILNKTNVINNVVDFTLSVLIIVLDVIALIVLLSTASRTSILCLAIFGLLIFYFIVTNTSKIQKKIRLILRATILFFSAVIIIFVLSDQLATLFVDSNRMKNIVINLPLLAKNGRWLIGLGLFNPGLFGTSGTVYGRSYFVDNYYLSVMLETGIIGLILIILLLVMIGKNLIKCNKKSKNIVSYIIVAMFVAQLISGTGETDVINYMFPSSFVFISIYFLHIQKTFDKRLRIKKGVTK